MPECSQQVVFVAPCKGGGKEAELYWRWVEEIKSPLPKGFQRNFHNAAILLQVRVFFCRERLPSASSILRT